MTGEPTDEQLLRRGLGGGDELAARLLYRRHTPALHRLALRLGGPPEDALDLVHDTWLRAAASVSRFAGRSAVRTWLMGILINRSRETRRAAGRAELVALPDDLLSPEPAAPVLADRLDLERAVALLPPGYREVLLLHDVEGHTHQEIAGILGVDIGTSKSQLTRARRAMIRALDPGQRRHHG